jgi:hypothetical protein
LLEGKGGIYTSTLKQYQTKADYFACACLKKNGGYNIQTTPGGLMYVREWNNLQYASAAAYLLAVYSDYLSAANAKLNCPDGLVQPQGLLDFARSQVMIKSSQETENFSRSFQSGNRGFPLQADYILGKNRQGMSYVVGYGPKYPIRVHHRGSSIPSIFAQRSSVSCVQGFDSWYRRSQGDPNVIYGALVGGPDENDNYSDDRSNYEQSEPTLSGTAPLVGLFAKLYGGSLGSYGGGSYKPYETTKPAASSYKATPTTYSPKQSGAQIEFLHSITSNWIAGNTRYYRHKVIIKNNSQKPISDLKLKIEDLSGPIWGLNPTGQKYTYQLPQWQKTLRAGQAYDFVYVQGGPQAKVSVLSYN